MPLEDIVYSLPSTQWFLDSIARNVGQNVVVVLLPDNLSREMVGRLVRNRLDLMSGISFCELSNPGQSDPVAACFDAMGASWPSEWTKRNIENLLCCDDLPDLLYVHRISPGDSRWPEFIGGWARERLRLRNSGRGRAPSLCVIAKLRDFQFTLPENGQGITYKWWWGFPSSLEMRLACRITNDQQSGEVELGRWREYVLSGLVSSDVQLGSEVWSEVEKDIEQIVEGLARFWDTVEDPTAIPSVDGLSELVKDYQGPFDIGQELPLHFWEPWSKGALVYTPEHGLEVHPALLAHAGRKIEVEKRLWRGQAELLLPILNEVRLKVCTHLTGAYGDDWPVKWGAPASEYELEQVKITPLATELGYIHHLFVSTGPAHVLNANRHLSNLVLNAKTMRNQVAHNKPVPYRLFAELCRERNRVGC